MLQWEDVRYFLAVHRAGSLSGAGRELRVNQSTVGRRIKALEEALEARLFDRTREGFALAPAGEALLPRAEAAEDELHAAQLELSGHQAQVQGALRVTAPETFGARYIGALLCEFIRLHPEVRVEFVADNKVLNLTRREADVSIRFSRPIQANLVMRKLGETGFGLYGSKTYFAARPWRGLSRLSEHAVIGFDESVGRWPEARRFEAMTQGLSPVFRANTLHAILYAAEAGAGVAYLPCYLAEPSPKLVRVLGSRECGRDPFWLVLHKDLRPSARVRMLIDFLEKRTAQDADVLGGPPGPARSYSA